MPDEHSNTVVSAVGSVGGLHEASDSSVVAGKKRKVSEVAEDCLKVLKEQKTGMLARWVSEASCAASDAGRQSACSAYVGTSKKDRVRRWVEQKLLVMKPKDLHARAVDCGMFLGEVQQHKLCPKSYLAERLGTVLDGKPAAFWDTDEPATSCRNTVCIVVCVLVQNKKKIVGTWSASGL